MAKLTELSPLDIVRAGKWHTALFTTYALSLGFFEGVVLPSLQRAGTRDISILSDVEGVIGALSETGARHVGRAYAVDPVGVADGVFHPKLGVLVGDERTHLLVGSGNLTFGGWGHNLEFLEHLTPEAHPAAFGDAAAFLRKLPQTGRVSIAQSRNLGATAAALNQVANGVDEGQIRLLHNLDRSISDQLIDFVAANGGAERLTVAAPYFGGPRAVRQLANDLGLEGFEVHVGSRLAVNGDHFPFAAEPRAKAMVLKDLQSSKDADRPFHAKLIEIVCAQTRLILTGSVNGSLRALSDPQNVELAVLRIEKDRTVFARKSYSGALPELPAPPDQVVNPADAGVLQASYTTGILEGRLFAPGVTGTWEASVQAGDAWTALDAIAVDAGGYFRIETRWFERVMYGGVRTTLTLRLGISTFRGFVCFPDLLSAARRLGTIAAPLLRLTGDADDDDDWIAILEWFARNPDETVTPWGGSGVKGPAKARPDVVVPLSALGPQPDFSGGMHGGAEESGHTLDRLLSRLRLVIGGHTAGLDSGDKSDPDEATGEKEEKVRGQKRKKLADSFERLVDVLAGRIPQNPVPELHRLAEIGIFWLLRHLEDPERIVAFLERWLALASQYLRLADEEGILRSLTIGLIALDASNRNSPELGRRRLIDIFGAAQLSNGSLASDLNVDAIPALRRLVDATVGLASWNAMLERMGEVRVALDDIHVIVAALRAGAALPAIKPTGFAAELAHLESQIERGRVQNIHYGPRGTTACPKNHISLSAARLEQFRQLGIVKMECCGGILLRSDT